MAAGEGFKTFATGDVLTASDVNGYLMQGVWVFADAAERTSEVTSPQEGNMSFLKDTNSLEYYSGSAWVSASGSSGALTLVSATTFSGVSTHSVNNCFTSTYRYYKILCDFTESLTTNRNLFMRLRASSVDSTASYNAVDVYSYNAVVGAETDPQGTDEFYLGGIGASMTLGSLKVELFNPQGAAPTGIQWGLAGYQSASFFGYTGIGTHTASTSYDGFTIYTSSENITGTIKVYGYQN